MATKKKKKNKSGDYNIIEEDTNIQAQNHIVIT